jgi:hypothetical protein
MKIILFGFLAWLVPFIAAFPFYGPKGLTIDIFLFKTIMIIIGTIVGVLLFVRYFREIKKNYIQEGAVVGLAWFAISVILDMLILLPMSGSDLSSYFAGIGLRYLTLPIIGVGMGQVLADKKK